MAKSRKETSIRYRAGIQYTGPGLQRLGMIPSPWHEILQGTHGAVEIGALQCLTELAWAAQSGSDVLRGGPSEQGGWGHGDGGEKLKCDRLGSRQKRERSRTMSVRMIGSKMLEIA